MRYGVVFAAFLITIMTWNTAQARDTSHRFPISEPMSTSTADELHNVQFYFGDQPHPPVSKTVGTYTTRRTANAFMKADKEACDWAFLSAMKTLWERAVKEGANAVVNIRSVTTGETVSSATEYVCRAGNVVAKVYLEGKVVFIE